jgi:carboxynorspermidine decarboxylase
MTTPSTMSTKAGDAGAFRRLDLTRVPSPAFVVDEARLEENLKMLAEIGEHSGAHILLALKAFSMWSLAPLVMKHLNGTCASGLWEARLAASEYGGHLSTYGAAYKAENMPEIFHLSDHVIFNSPAQIDRFSLIAAEATANGEHFDIGLRLNPEHSEGEVEKYDPCQPHSRLGFPISQLTPEHMAHVGGLHFHTLCEQGFEPLKRTWDAIKDQVMPYTDNLKWLNFGGGHHITRADYDRDALVDLLKQLRTDTGCEIYLEPGEAVALDAGILVGEILDVMDNGMPVAITDISATCHMPDVIEAPYRPEMLDEATDGVTVRLGGPSCLAGDSIGDYRFKERPAPGTRIAFLDQAHYSMVKTTTFNGVPLPAILVWNSETDEIRLVKEFDDTVFKNRLS